MSSGKGDRGWSAVVSGGESKETAHGDQAKSTADAKGQSKQRIKVNRFRTDPITGAIYRSMSSRKMRSLTRAIQHRAEQEAKKTKDANKTKEFADAQSEASRIQILNAFLLASPDYNPDTTPLLTPTTSVASRSTSLQELHS